MNSTFAAENLKTFPSSSLITDCNCFRSFEEQDIFVSCAKMLKVNLFEGLSNLLIDNRHSSGPRVEA